MVDSVTCNCVSRPLVCSSQWNQKRAWDLEVELQAVGSSFMDARIWTWVFSKEQQVATSPAPIYVFWKLLFHLFFKFHSMAKPNVTCTCLSTHLIWCEVAYGLLICVTMFCCGNNVLITDPAGVWRRPGVTFYKIPSIWCFGESLCMSRTLIIKQ